MYLKQQAAIVLILVATGIGLRAQNPKSTSTEPVIHSVFPLALRRGLPLEIQIRGSGLEGSYAAWFDCDAVRAKVKTVEPIDLDADKRDPADKGKKPRLGQRVVLDVQSDANSALGAHVFRIVSNRGLSNALSIDVTAENVVLEQSSGKAGEYQQVSWPAVVNGRISKDGEMDYYAVEVNAGTDLLFEVDSLGGSLDPTLTLFEPSMSWLSSDRLVQLAFSDDVANRPMAVIPYRFGKSGRYVVAVGAFVGIGNPDSSYRLSISRSTTGQRLDTTAIRNGRPAHPLKKQWQEREFARVIESKRLDELSSRTVPVTAPKDQESTLSGDKDVPAVEKATTKPLVQEAQSMEPQQLLRIVKEREPNDGTSEAPSVSLPAVIEGAIDHPGDIDCFRFIAKSGETIVFEIQTPNVTPSPFSPRLELLTTNNEELLTNVYQRIGGDGDDWVQSLEPKVVYTFDQGGEYTLRLRDLTSRNGSPDYRYRLLLRDQIPHVGEIEIKDDHINITKGEARKLTISAGREEGFEGQVAIRVENLPPGVVVLPGSDIDPPQGPPFAKVHPERYVPKTQIVTLMLLANEQAGNTEMPTWASVVAQPIVAGKIGRPFWVKDLAIMVVERSRPLQTGEKRP